MNFDITKTVADPSATSAKGLGRRIAVGALVVCALGCGENRTVVDRPPYAAPQQPAATCTPNLDGRIDPAEFRANLI